MEGDDNDDDGNEDDDEHLKIMAFLINLKATCVIH